MINDVLQVDALMDPLIIQVFPKFLSHVYPCSHPVCLQMLTTPTHLQACNSHDFQPTTICHVEKSSPPDMEALQGEVTVFSAHLCKG